MVTENANGEILLERFDLDGPEMAEAQTIVDKYAERIKNLTDYTQIKLEMKVHPKGKNRHFEIKGHVMYKNGKAVSEETDMNPFVAIDKVMNKMFGEIQHQIRK